MKSYEKVARNGVNVEALLGARKALTDAPEAARFTWRANTTWVRGTHSRTTVQKFFGLGTEQSHKREFNYEADHPEIFASEDIGSFVQRQVCSVANPPEPRSRGSRP